MQAAGCNKNLNDKSCQRNGTSATEALCEMGVCDASKQKKNHHLAGAGLTHVRQLRVDSIPRVCNAAQACLLKRQERLQL